LEPDSRVYSKLVSGAFEQPHFKYKVIPHKSIGTIRYRQYCIIPLMRVEVGHNQALRTGALFNGLYNIDHSRGDGGANSLWFRGYPGADALSTRSIDHPTSFTLSTFLKLIETGQIVIPVGARALDIGYGTGHDLARFSALGYDSIHGVDVSEVSTDKAKKLLDGHVIPAKRDNIICETGNLFELLPSGNQYDLVWSRGVGDYVEEENQQEYFELLQNETARDGLIVLSFVTNHPKSLVPGQTIVPCHNIVPLHPVNINMVRRLFSPERGWKILAAKIERDKEDIHHADGTLNPEDRHSHDFLHVIAQNVGAKPLVQTVEDLVQQPFTQSYETTSSGLLVAPQKRIIPARLT